jgi:hypothetical protein
LNPPKQLLPVPAFIHDLTIKATHTGITVLKEGRFKKRYTGSRQAAVDINGKLYLKAADMKRANAAEAVTDRAQKKGMRPSSHPPAKIGDPHHQEHETTDKKLSTPPREYHVNKLEVRQRLFTMINTMKGGRELYFWTVTFPKGTTDQVAYRAFNTWLTTLRQKKFLRNYLWIAERQENGTIHFHIAIPHKMSVVHANRMMRVTLATFAKRREIPFSTFQCKRYNGIDIAKNRKTGRVTNFAIKKGARSLAHYLTKYVTKNDTRFSHLAWHNSRGFSALFTGITFTVPEFLAYGFKELILHCSVIHNEFFMFFPWRGEPPGAITSHLYDLNSYLQHAADQVKAS